MVMSERRNHDSVQVQFLTQEHLLPYISSRMMDFDGYGKVFSMRCLSSTFGILRTREYVVLLGGFEKQTKIECPSRRFWKMGKLEVDKVEKLRAVSKELYIVDCNLERKNGKAQNLLSMTPCAASCGTSA